MTYPIRNVPDAVNMLDRYWADERPLNLEEERELHALLANVVGNVEPVLRHLRGPLPPDVGLRVQNLRNLFGVY